MVGKEAVNINQVKIDYLHERDIESLRQILQEHVRNRQTGGIEFKEIQSITGWMRGGLDKDRNDYRHYLVARAANGEVLGCIAWSAPDPQMLAHFSTTAEVSAEPLNLFISSTAQNLGVGTKLFQALAQAVREEGKMQLIANSGPRYKNAWTFHDKMFDRRGGYIYGKYGPGGDAMTWVKAL